MDHRVDGVTEALKASPAIAWLFAWANNISLPDVATVLTIVLIAGQIVKLGFEFKDRRAAKRKESVCRTSESD